MTWRILCAMFFSSFVIDCSSKRNIESSCLSDDNLNHCETCYIFWRSISISWIDPRIGIYGDEANCSENLYFPFKVFGMFLNLLHFRPKNVRLSRYLLFSMRSEWMVNPLTLRPLLAKLTWSLNLAFGGIDPVTQDWMCPGRQRFVVAEFRGDQDFMRVLWQHAASWTSVFVCYQCRAKGQAGPYTYLDFREHPDWESTEHTNISFIHTELPPCPCYLMLI